MKTTKIEIEIPSIEQIHVVDAVAREILRSWSADGEGNGYERESALGRALRAALLERIDQVAKDLVRAEFDEVVRGKVGAAVDAVLAEGWHDSDSFGGKRGERMDLRGLINRLLKEKQRGSSGYVTETSFLEHKVQNAVSAIFDKDFTQVLQEARATLREKLDRSVMEKVAETIQSALGLRAR